MSSRFVSGLNVWWLIRQIVFYGGLIALWQVLASAHIWSPYLFPSPLDVWASLRANAESGILFDSARAASSGWRSASSSPSCSA